MCLCIKFAFVLNQSLKYSQANIFTLFGTFVCQTQWPWKPCTLGDGAKCVVSVLGAKRLACCHHPSNLSTIRETNVQHDNANRRESSSLAGALVSLGRRCDSNLSWKAICTKMLGRNMSENKAGWVEMMGPEGSQWSNQNEVEAVSSWTST
jgi:hypothetical protein